MDAETLYTATKWDILKLLEQRPLAPIEIAAELHSSLANVSQQLRLLEMAGLIASSRVGNRDKGQPRMRYRIAGDLSYLIATTDGFVDKKAMKLSAHNKIVLRIWFIDDLNVRYALEKAFWELEPHLATIEKISFAGVINGQPVLEIKGGRLPTSLSVGGVFGKVAIKASSAPKGTVLFAREA